MMRHTRGFSILELIISIAIIAIIGTVAGMSLVSYQRYSAAETTAKNIAGELRIAQNKAISGEDGNYPRDGRGDAWGVRFANGTQDTYALFYGNAYSAASTTETIYLTSSTVFTDPAEGNNKDVIFTKRSGTTTPTTITVATVDGAFSQTITVATSTISTQ